eukprot:s118_g20.t1
MATFSPPPETTTISKRHLANWLSDALDLTGKWQVNQAANLCCKQSLRPKLDDVHRDCHTSLRLATASTPVGFSNPTVDALIVNPLYDQRTGMNLAQLFQLNFPNSSLVTSLSGGHCVHPRHGSDSFKVLLEFVFFGWKPHSVVGNFVKIDFVEGAKRAKLFMDWW